MLAVVECDENGRRAVVVATLKELCQYLLSLTVTLLHQLFHVNAHGTAKLYLLEKINILDSNNEAACFGPRWVTVRL